jgi:hypothetical protein
MKKSLIYFIAFCLVLFSFNISAQEPEADVTTSTPSNGGSAAGGDSKVDYKTYNPLAVHDYRFDVNAVTFNKRYADNGRGQVLDVQIELKSNVREDVEYSVYVLAVNETNSVEPVSRALAPHPKWRPVDPKKEKKIINFSDLMPQNVAAKEIWGEKQFNSRKADVDKRQNLGQRVKLDDPTLEEYVLYLSKNPQKALKYKLYGEKGPQGPEKVFVSNYSPIKAEEDAVDVYESYNKHNYTVYQNKYKTTVFSHHYNQYRPNFYPYNKIVVLIFDPNRKENQLVYKIILDLGNLKVKQN